MNEETRTALLEHAGIMLGLQLLLIEKRVVRPSIHLSQGS